MNSFICIFVCVYQALQNSLVYTISVISVFVSYTYVCYVLVYFVLYVYNCMHKRTIKYLVSCILYCYFRQDLENYTLGAPVLWIRVTTN